MSAHCSSMHKIRGSVPSTFGRMAGTSRSFVAAARLHPAGFAVPSVVIAVAVAFVTFVTAVVVRVIPPDLFGSGSPPFIQPSASQLRHRPHQQPVLAGPPMLRPLGGSQGQGPAGGHGQGSKTLLTPRFFPITPGPTPTAGNHPASGSPAGTPATVSVTVGTSNPVPEVNQAPTAVAGTTATTVGQVGQGVAGAIGTVTGTVTAATGTVGAVTGTVRAVTGAVEPVTGTVAAVTGAVGTVTGTVGAVPGTVGAVTGAAGAVTSTVGLAVSAPGLG